MSGYQEDSGSLDESTDETLDGGAPEATSEIAAESSPAAPEGGDKASVLDVVRDAVDAKAPEAEPASPAENENRSQPAPGSQTDDPDANVPFRNHPRFRELIAERNTLKGEAARIQALDKFLDENAMTGDEAAQALNLFALRKRDPEAAWAELKPLVQQLLIEIGEVIPGDLRAQVNAGQISEQAARLIAKERAKAGRAQGQMTFAQQQAERKAAREAQEAQARAAESVMGAARAWEAEKSTDPDFKRKIPDIHREVLFLQHTEGKPTTPDGVRLQLDKALKSVNARIAARSPRRPEVRPLTGGSTSANTRGKPGSLLDIVQRGGAA